MLNHDLFCFVLPMKIIAKARNIVAKRKNKVECDIIDMLKTKQAIMKIIVEFISSFLKNVT